MEGWLEKKGSFIKNWKTRWFALSATELEYFVDESKRDRKGGIEINASTCVLTRDGTNHLFKFGVQTGNRVLELSADSEDIRLQWMDTLHSAVNTRRCDHSTGGLPSTKGISKLLPVKKSKMEADTPMNRALKGQAAQTNRKQRNTEASHLDSGTTEAPHSHGAGAGARGGLSKKTMTRRTARQHTSGERDKTTVEEAGVAEGGSTGVREEEDVNISSLSTDKIKSKTPSETTEGDSRLPPSPSSTDQMDGPLLPDGWERVVTETGQVYYFHRLTRVSRWDVPSEEVAEALNQRLEESQKHVQASVERRRLEREHERLKERQESIEVENIKANVAVLIRDWMWPPEMSRERSLGELLMHIPDLLGDAVIPQGSISQEPLTLVSPPTEVKKAYLRTLRLVHPDKLLAGGHVDVSTRLIAQEIFIKLSETYNQYRAAHDL